MNKLAEDIRSTTGPTRRLALKRIKRFSMSFLVTNDIRRRIGNNFHPRWRRRRRRRWRCAWQEPRQYLSHLWSFYEAVTGLARKRVCPIDEAQERSVDDFIDGHSGTESSTSPPRSAGMLSRRSTPSVAGGTRPLSTWAIVSPTPAPRRMTCRCCAKATTFLH